MFNIQRLINAVEKSDPDAARDMRRIINGLEPLELLENMELEEENEI